MVTRITRVIPLCGSLPFYEEVFGLRAATLATGGGRLGRQQISRVLAFLPWRDWKQCAVLAVPKVLIGATLLPSSMTIALSDLADKAGSIP